MKADLIAPCGMNCRICKAYLRSNNPCQGCHHIEQNTPKTRVNCKLRICKERKGKFCYECTQFPCDWLKHLDYRYRTKYGMSEIENLIFIRENGMKKFLEQERKKWFFEKGVLCVHDKKYYE